MSLAVSAKETAKLHLVHNGGDEITEEGPATGTLAGTVRAYLNVGATLIAKFTIYARHGSISGEGSGEPKGNPEEPSFSGKMRITHGTGIYRHARGEGGFYGVLNRSSDAATVQTAGTLYY